MTRFGLGFISGAGPLTAVEYLVVAGGGGGGSSGGGGAGGVRAATGYAVAPGNYAITVGLGGTGTPSGGVANGTNGQNSVFNSGAVNGGAAITSNGGGGGGSNAGTGAAAAGSAGGSGGGGSLGTSGAGTGGAGTVGQGNNGGNGVVPASPWGGGGGGGAGQVGSNCVGAVGGKGGDGVASSISGAAVSYGGGGGGVGIGTGQTGGAGGAGGGGAGRSGGGVAGGVGTDGLGGGGGSGSSAQAGKGGNGAVIISYPSPQRASGGTVTTSGGKVIHTFTASGMLTVGPPMQSLQDILTSLGLTSGLKISLDAGDILSAPASTTKWLDRSGLGHDFFRGVSAGAEASDPTFNGTPGNLSSSEYFSYDGGDYFVYDTTNEGWMQNLHKAGAKLTFAGWWFMDATTLVEKGLFGTSGWTGAAGGTGVHGQINNSSNGIQLTCFNGATVTRNIIPAGLVPTANAWNFIAISVDEAANVSHRQCNALVSSGSASYAAPSAGNAAQTFAIGSSGGANLIIKSGCASASFGLWEGVALTAAQLDAIYQATRTRFGV